MALTLTENQSKKDLDNQHYGPNGRMIGLNGHTTEEAIVEMMLRNVHNIKGKLIDLEKKLTACSS